MSISDEKSVLFDSLFNKSVKVLLISEIEPEFACCIAKNLIGCSESVVFSCA
ncbi:MAG: hypothetical protein ACR2F1_14335 [Nitrososphaeraceae archaeon]